MVVIIKPFNPSVHILTNTGKGNAINVTRTTLKITSLQNFAEGKFSIDKNSNNLTVNNKQHIMQRTINTETGLHPKEINRYDKIKFSRKIELTIN